MPVYQHPENDIRSFRLYTREEICGIAGVKPDTLKKSIQLGKIILSRCETRETEEAINKSTRSVLDDSQSMGKACTNTLERVLSSKTGMPSLVEHAQTLCKPFTFVHEREQGLHELQHDPDNKARYNPPFVHR